jgi:hypothetical protein
MALPINATPVYTLEVPSDKRKFKYRPFVVKDEKALLIAQQSDSVEVMLDTVKEVIKSCAKSDINVDKLASFDIEYIFLQMRAQSVGEIVELVFSCDIDHGEENVKAKVTKQINLFDAKVEFFDGHASKINLFEDVGVVMKYPNIDTLKKLEADLGSQEIDQIVDIITDCIDYIYDAEEVYYTKDTKKEEMIDFINNLTSDQFNKLRQFFQTMPQLRVYIDYTCPVCGRDHKKYMEGLASFF